MADGMFPRFDLLYKVLNWYGSFNSRGQYLEMRSADVWSIMPILCCRFLLLFLLLYLIKDSNLIITHEKKLENLTHYNISTGFMTGLSYISVTSERCFYFYMYVLSGGIGRRIKNSKAADFWWIKKSMHYLCPYTKIKLKYCNSLLHKTTFTGTREMDRTLLATSTRLKLT